MILRMLTPYELMTHYNIKDNSELFQASFFPYYSQFYLTSNIQRILRTEKIIAKEPKIQKNQRSDKQINQQEQILSKKLKKQYEKAGKMSMKQVNQAFRKIDRKSIYKINNGGKPILEPAQQQQICKFVKNCVKKGWVLTKPIIANKAKQIANNNPNFMGSIGWVKNFLKRHPHMKELYDQSRVDHYNNSVKHQAKIIVSGKNRKMEKNQSFKQQLSFSEVELKDVNRKQNIMLNNQSLSENDKNLDYFSEEFGEYLENEQ